jgi:hypothetical protein
MDKVWNSFLSLNVSTSPCVIPEILLGLSIADVSCLSAKSRGGYDDGGGKSRRNHIQPATLSEEMESFLQSLAWKEKIHLDQFLYEAANRLMDRMIDERLDHEAFEQQLRNFRDDNFPCADSGEYNNITNCIWKDSGKNECVFYNETARTQYACAQCSLKRSRFRTGYGNDCLDDIATELDLQALFR